MSIRPSGGASTGGTGTSVSLAEKGAWATTTAYVVGDIVTQTGQRYIAKTAHTSGTFATDLAAAKWTVLDAAVARSVVTKTTTYTAVDGDIVLASASGGAWALTLPAVAAGRLVTVKKTDSSANAITITPASGTIDGTATVAVSTQYASRDVVSDGTNWFVV